MADPDLLERFVALNASAALADAGGPRSAARRGVLAEAARLVPEGASAVLRALPARIGTLMAPFGWMWNGFYVAGADGRLRLATAHGPPVCSELESVGGVLTSGMCFDCLRMNQTLAAPDVKAWPGYVSCDATSHLQTVSGLVAPVRDAAGKPIAVWDLDAIQPIEPEDVRFADVLFASLARCVPFTPAAFEEAAQPVSG